jgi:hypothetical protein
MLLIVWALTEASLVPAALYSFLRYNNAGLTLASTEYWRHHYLIELGFLITRIVGYSLTSRWLFKAGPEVQQLLLPEMEAQAQD